MSEVRRISHILLPVLMFVLSSVLLPHEHLVAQSRKSIQPQFSDVRDHIPYLLEHRTVKRPKVAVVLSGGGARGVAGIGVLKVFEQAKIPIDLIVGTSMGSILGGLYASGYSIGQLEKMVDTTNWSDVLSFNDEARRADLFLDQKLATDRSILTVRFQGLQPVLPQSLSTGQRLTNYLNLLVLQGIYHPNPSFDDLRIPFRAVATDLVSGKAVSLDRGDLTEAMRASVSVPLLFSPVSRDSARLLDGGLVSNVPVDVARAWGADIVIAVDVTSPLRPLERLNAPWEVADQILGITMQAANQAQLANASLVIRPDIGGHLSDDFNDLDTLIAQGERAARNTLDQLRQLLSTRPPEHMAGRDNPTVYHNAHVQFDALQIDRKWLTPVMDLAREQHIPEQSLQLLVNQMYETGDFEDVRVDIETDSASARLSLVVVPTPVLQSVEILGNKRVGADTLVAAFQPLLGRRLNFHESHRAMEDILAVYRDRGYSLARVLDAKFDRSTGQGIIRLDEGIVYRMDIVGTSKTKDYVIWRELPWNEGEVFDVKRVSQGISNLYGSNLFEHVSILTHLEESDGENQVVVIKVRERSTELIRLGMRIDDERSLQPSIDIRDENVFGIGAELGFHAFGGTRNRSFVGEFKATRIFDSYFTFALRAYSNLRDVNVYGDSPENTTRRWSRIRIGEYRQFMQGASATFGTQLERLGTVTIEARLERQRVWSFFGAPVVTETIKVGSLRFGTKVDNLDRFPYPRNGLSMNFAYESTVLPLQDGVGFTKMTFSYDWYQTLGRFTFHPRFRLGFADETLPITEQFSLGGQESFFGLREDNLRGRQLLVASLEYRYRSPFRVFFDTYFFARYDLGSIWPAPAAIRLANLRHGVGLGIALDTPIGPVEFALGQSFYFRKEILENPLSLGPLLGYFSIGYAF